MSQAGCTPFSKSFADNLTTTTSAIDDAFLSCIAFTHRTRNTRSMFVNTWIRSFSKLVCKLSNDGSFEDRLANLQAVLLFQIMAYFGDQDTLYEIAEKCSQRVDNAIQLLQDDLLDYGRSIIACDSMTEYSEYGRWLLLESARRTILAHLFVKAIHFHSRRGYCELVPRLAVLPLTIDGDLWNAKSEGEWHNILQSKHIGPRIKPYFEAIDIWAADNQDNIDDFGVMLLGACKDVKG